MPSKLENENQYIFDVTKIHSLVQYESVLSKIVTEFVNVIITKAKDLLDINIIVFLNTPKPFKVNPQVPMNPAGVLLFISDAILSDPKAPQELKETIKEVKTNMLTVVGKYMATGEDGLVEEIMTRTFKRKNDLEKIRTLLESKDPEDLKEGRLLTRKILTDITGKMFELFCRRIALMGHIASSKRNSESIIQLEREYDLIKKFSAQAPDGVSPEMVEAFIHGLTAAGKEKQRNILGRDTVFVDEKLSREESLSNLLELTKLVAEGYNEYGTGFEATLLSRELEDGMIQKMVLGIENKGVCLDLGCANGKTTQLLSRLGFAEVVGYDVSPYMVGEAQGGEKLDGVKYIEHDLFKGIPGEENSVDCIVSNLGSASEVSPYIFEEVSRVLKLGGKAFLSFYNDKALMNAHWPLSQGSMQIVINTECDVIEVPVISENGTNKVFKIYARSISDENIKSFAKGANLEIESVSSHSVKSSDEPPIYLKDPKRREEIKEWEKGHAPQGPYGGPYITVVLSK